MRRALFRSTMTVVAAVVMVTSLLSLGPLLWLATRHKAVARRVLVAPENALVIAVFVALITIAILALLIALLAAHRQAKASAEPLEQLARQARRLGAGETVLTPLQTGIPEVDSVSSVLATTAQELTRTLVAERDRAADASHQLRTPLAALLLRLEEIATTDDPDVARGEAGVAIAQVERLTGVVDDVLGRGRAPIRAREAVSLDAVIAALQQEWQPAFAAARRSMHVHGERGLMVLIRRAALSEILSTLIENSLAHGRGTVSVEARRSGPSVVVEMSDQGDGIPSGLAPHIFERSVSSRGSGLGLALARDLAENNYGRLELVRAEPAVFALFLSEASSSNSPSKTNRR